ncbi:DUF2442 domain-containing protein [candidate division KSB1 bacterium]|nr:DUF2442 domain-containing protein [candidate division KSB1 bacterium]
MNPRIKSVQANDDFTLSLEFTNNEKKIFNVKPYLTKGIFKELNDITLFKTAKVFDGTVQWIHEQDLCPDTLYLKSVPVKN